jgi:NAD(P)-dependent dehydrogenase (short-subunit alcohol dehydrogenase family)
MDRLKDKVAIITGGSGGIGVATAKLFVEEGAKVLLVDIDEDALKECVSDIGESASYIVADVSEEEQVNMYTQTAVDRYGKIDIVLLNAGIEGTFKLLIEHTVEDFDKLMGVNLRGAWLGIKAAVPQMINTGGGSITLTSSIAGLQGSPGLGPYTTSKHALVGLMRTAALEYAQFGIRVNTVHPSPVETRMMRSIEAGAAEMTALLGITKQAEELKAMMADAIPMKRYATPEEVANLFLFLSSDEAKFITGSRYSVDGGMNGGRSLSVEE